MPEDGQTKCEKCGTELQQSKEGYYFCPKCSDKLNEGKELYEEAFFDVNEYKTEN
jgi:uncharacterized Zn finger protein (UPF0148 family)